MTISSCSLRDLSLFGESSARSWSEGLGLGSVEILSSCQNRPDGADRSYAKTPVLQIGADIYCDSQ